MFVVIVDVLVRPEYVEHFRKAVTRQGENSITREKGCLGFEILQDPEKPTSFVLYETYTDAPTFYEVHVSTPHFADYAATTADWIETKSIRALTKLWPTEHA
jgi:quinol monooxygenase YgiN